MDGLLAAYTEVELVVGLWLGLLVKLLKYTIGYNTEKPCTNVNTERVLFCIWEVVGELNIFFIFEWILILK